MIWNVKYGLAIDQSRNPNQRSSSWATNYHHPNDDHKQVFLGSVSNISVKNISSPTGGGNLLGQALALPDSRKGCRKFSRIIKYLYLYLAYWQYKDQIQISNFSKEIYYRFFSKCYTSGWGDSDHSDRQDKRTRWTLGWIHQVLNSVRLIERETSWLRKWHFVTLGAWRRFLGRRSW